MQSVAFTANNPFTSPRDTSSGTNAFGSNNRKVIIPCIDSESSVECSPAPWEHYRGTEHEKLLLLTDVIHTSSDWKVGISLRIQYAILEYVEDEKSIVSPHKFNKVTIYNFECPHKAAEMLPSGSPVLTFAKILNTGYT